MKSAVAGLRSLGEFAKTMNINVIVENHGGYSSNGEWLTNVMKQVDLKNVGTLPDFGNFCLRRTDNGTEWGGACVEEYDRYKGTKEMMPYAKGVSAKTFDFDAQGNDTLIDYVRMMKIIKESGFGVLSASNTKANIPKSTKASAKRKPCSNAPGPWCKNYFFVCPCRLFVNSSENEQTNCPDKPTNIHANYPTRLHRQSDRS